MEEYVSVLELMVCNSKGMDTAIVNVSAIFAVVLFSTYLSMANH